MDTEGGPNPRAETQHPNAPPPGKRWWVVGLGAIAAAFLAALGGWLFSLVRPVLDHPFERPLEVYVNDSETPCDGYALPVSLLEDVPVDPVENGPPEQLARFDGEWIVAHGGLPVVARRIELTLHGNGDEVVVIHSIDIVDFEPIEVDDEMVVIRECLPVGGAMLVPTLVADFASQPPVLELTDPDLRFPYQVSKDDPEVFDIEIMNMGEGDEQVCFCRWNIGISWSAGDDLHQMVLKGESIGVATAIPSVEWADHWYVDGEWTTEPPGL